MKVVEKVILYIIKQKAVEKDNEVFQEKICSVGPNKVKNSETMFLFEETVFDVEEEWDAQKVNTHYSKVPLQTKSRNKEGNVNL